MGDSFNQPIDNLPNTLTLLKLGYSFNQSIDNLPNTIKELTLGKNFNQPIDDLPNSLTHLTIGEYYNSPIDNLPNSLTHLTLGNKFNQPINNLPNSLTHLIIGKGVLKYFSASCIFNQELNNLPNSLIELEFSYESIFQKSLNNLPNSLKKITLSGYYLGSIDDLPDNIETIIFGPTWYNFYENTFGPLCLKNKIYKLPKKLKHLYIDYKNEGKDEYTKLDFNDLALVNKSYETSTYEDTMTLQKYLDYSKK